MQGTYKPFNQSLFANNDLKSREVVKAYMKSMGFELVDNSNKYDVDLVSPDGSLKVEVEHRLNWKGKEFPFSTVRVLERKLKYFKDGSANFCILSNDFSRIGVITAKKLQAFMTPENFRIVDNCFVNGEGCYEVPAHAFKWVSV